MKLTAEQFYFVYFCMLEEPAMFKPLSYSSEFVIIRQLLMLSTDNASFKAKNIRAGSPDLFMSMACIMNISSIFSAQFSLRSTELYYITGGSARGQKVKPKTWRILTFADAISMTTGPKCPQNCH